MDTYRQSKQKQGEVFPLPLPGQKTTRIPLREALDRAYPKLYAMQKQKHGGGRVKRLINCRQRLA